MRLRHVSTLFFSLALATTVVACDGDDEGSDSGSDNSGGTGGSGDSGDSGGSGMQGFSDCTPMGFEDTPTTCQPGQYCADPNLADCVPGCLSNVNCAADQSCSIPSGESIGSCVNDAASISEADFCMKLLTCDPSGTMEQCSTIYTATNATCHECIISENCGDINDFEGACDSACGLG